MKTRHILKFLHQSTVSLYNKKQVVIIKFVIIYMEKRKRRICHPHYARCLHEKYTLMIDFRGSEAADSEFAVESCTRMMLLKLCRAQICIFRFLSKSYSNCIIKNPRCFLICNQRFITNYPANVSNLVLLMRKCS